MVNGYSPFRYGFRFRTKFVFYPPLELSAQGADGLTVALEGGELVGL